MTRVRGNVHGNQNYLAFDGSRKLLSHNYFRISREILSPVKPGDKRRLVNYVLFDQDGNKVGCIRDKRSITFFYYTRGYDTAMLHHVEDQSGNPLFRIANFNMNGDERLEVTCLDNKNLIGTLGHHFGFTKAPIRLSLSNNSYCVVKNKSNKKDEFTVIDSQGKPLAVLKKVEEPNNVEIHFICASPAERENTRENVDKEISLFHQRALILASAFFKETNLF
ncbi:hypothetical protein AX774_g7889 [Zancudomyces culisetae]|uniref:Uncharacterized protein n=1 Tax=Zancudomyces culisetae TaxID=1213189 RepID=A0A1R1PCN3_ZANCU|nr:hypothetical protein AX774_g7889 [Zancudomyces culisetae]|eukprot:OMH78720.1 hypothetical protein AX774_g7889 [Zancudomyces culisetae]